MQTGGIVLETVVVKQRIPSFKVDRYSPEHVRVTQDDDQVHIYDKEEARIVGRLLLDFGEG